MNNSVAGSSTDFGTMAEAASVSMVYPVSAAQPGSLSPAVPTATQHSALLAEPALVTWEMFSANDFLEQLHSQLKEFEAQYSGQDPDKCKPVLDHFDNVIRHCDQLNEKAALPLREALSRNQIETINSTTYFRQLRQEIECYLKQLKPNPSFPVENIVHPLLKGSLEPSERDAILEVLEEHGELVALLHEHEKAVKIVEDNSRHFSELQESIYSLRNLRTSARLLISQAYSRAGFLDQALAIKRDASLLYLKFGHAQSKPAVSSISRRDRFFNSMYEELRKFKESNGHCEVPMRYIGNKKMPTWIANLRIRRKRGLLSEAHIELLDQLQFCWTSNRKERFFSLMYEELTIFKQIHGHCDVPLPYAVNPQLAKWTANLRGRRKKGMVSQDKIELLDRLNFRWSTNQSNWYQRFYELARFIKEHDHSTVPIVYPASPYLGTWVHNLRKEIERNAISEERKAQLAAIGFDFEIDNPKWYERFEQLRAFKNNFGHCRVPHRWSENSSLAYWVNIQRDKKRWNKLADEQIKLLQLLDFEWEAPRGRPQNGPR